MDNVLIMPSKSGAVRVNALPNGKHRILVEGKQDIHVPATSWDTAYPLALIEAIHAAKSVYICDEIMREEDPRYVENSLRREVLGYVPAAGFAGKRVLDFGCGSGASTMVLGRLLPPCEIVGVELEERLLRIARLRAEHFGRNAVRFLKSPSGDSLPENLGLFDYVIFSAVFEHLLPAERSMVLPLLWKHMKRGGILFLNQTPHRYSPVELHTTHLPLINYLPDRLALHVARHFSRYVRREAGWETLLREGIRGGTVHEILSILRTCGLPMLIEPLTGDRIDLWHGRLSARHAWLKKGVWGSLKALKALTGMELMPELALAIRKEA